MPAVVLLVHATTVPLVRIAYRAGNFVDRRRGGFFDGSTQAQYKRLEQVSKPFEDDVVLRRPEI